MLKGQNASVGDLIHMTCRMGDLALEFVGLNTGTGYGDIVTIRGDWTAPSHFHINYELHYMRSGSARIGADDRAVEVGPGSFCLIPPYSSHYVLSSSDDLSHFAVSFGLKRSGPRDDGVFSEYGYYSGLFGAVKSAEIYGDSDFMKQCCDRIEALCLEGDSEVSRHKNEALLRVLFIEVAELIAQRTGAASTSDRILEDPALTTKHTIVGIDDQGENVRRKWIIDNLVADRYLENPSYDELSALLRLSRRQCIRTVRRLTGMTLQGLLTKQRMSVAKMLLESTSLPLGEVALRAGFDSYSGFFTAFRKYYGLSPSGYAAEARCGAEEN